MKRVNTDVKNSFHRESVEGVDAVLERMTKIAIGGGGTWAASYSNVLDISPNTIKTWRRRGSVPLKYLEGFAREYNVSLDYLMHGGEVHNEPVPDLIASSPRGVYVIEAKAGSKEKDLFHDVYLDIVGPLDWQEKIANGESIEISAEEAKRMHAAAAELLECATRHPRQRHIRDSVYIKQYDVKASAGHGNLIHEENVVGVIEVPRAYVRHTMGLEPERICMIRVDGPSMFPTLVDGEWVVVDLRCDRFDDDDVYLLQFDGRLRIKRMQLQPDGSVLIKSDNPEFPSQTVTAEKADLLRVIGKVRPWKFGMFKL